ncbi:HU family DNA-binding protein [candidate division KSB1 bacterium]|nr:HU family DNA-binding protein [candidate division KSB1 bacterium]
MSANVKYLTLSDAPRKGQKQPAYSVEFLRSFVQETLALVEEGLRRDGVVRMHDFGTFQLKWVNERSGRNPRTGEPLVIPGQYRVVFKPAGKIEHRLNRRYAHLRPEIVETPLVPLAVCVAVMASALAVFVIVTLCDARIPPEKLPLPVGPMLAVVLDNVTALPAPECETTILLY